MDRADLVAKYKALHEQAPEKTLNWYGYGEAYGFLSGNGDIAWVLAQLRKLKSQWEERGVEKGYMHDAVYGSYGTYCVHRCRILDEAIAEIGAIDG